MCVYASSSSTSDVPNMMYIAGCVVLCCPMIRGSLTSLVLSLVDAKCLPQILCSAQVGSASCAEVKYCYKEWPWQHVSCCLLCDIDVMSMSMLMLMLMCDV